MNLFSRWIVAWRVDDNMEDPLILLPLWAAQKARQSAADLIGHSDRGGQYISNEVQELVSLWRIRTRSCWADDPYDNSFVESFRSRLKAELLEGGCFLSAEVFEYIECYYNRVLSHSSLGY